MGRKIKTRRAFVSFNKFDIRNEQNIDLWRCRGEASWCRSFPTGRLLTRNGGGKQYRWKVYDRRIRRSRTRPNKTLPFHEYYDHRPATRSPTRFLLPPPLFTATRRLPIIQSIIQFPFLSSGEIVRLPVRGTSMYSWGIWEKCIFTSGNFGLFHIFLQLG